jgi:large subunit ribosomal protein L22
MSSFSFIISTSIRRKLALVTSGNISCSSQFSTHAGGVEKHLRHPLSAKKYSIFQKANLANTYVLATASRFNASNSTWGINSNIGSRRNRLILMQQNGLSTQVTQSTTTVLPDGVQIHAEPTLIQPSIVQSADGRQFAAFELPKFQRKLKPYIVNRRLNRMRTFVGKQKDIRHSPWRMNLVCQFAAGQTLTDAIQQLEFCRKSMAPLVKKVLIRTANVADMKYGLQHRQLEVAECFATKGKPLKRIMIMGRGRAGRMEHKFSHFRVVLREIDFKLRIYQAPTLGQKKRWFIRQQQAESEYAKAKAERDEISRLEKETEAYRTKETKK